jgi:predicted dithiol-disulfide oxidoreductase (DUF899 family)
MSLCGVKSRMGWEMPWYMITGDFDKDFGVDEWRHERVPSTAINKAYELTLQPHSLATLDILHRG